MSPATSPGQGPAGPYSPATTIPNGKISWFGGGATASGIPTSKPGIAVYNQHTLGGWWLLHMPNGRLAILQQTDIGPAPWTGKSFDFSQGSLSWLGYNTGNFPTGAQVSGIYLGKAGQEIANNLTPAAAQLSPDLPNIAGWLTVVGKELTASGFKSSAPGWTDAGGKTAGPFDRGAINTTNTPQGGGSNAVLDSSSFFGMITSVEFWVRVFEGIAGIILLALGPKALTGTQIPNPVKTVAAVV